MGIANRADPKSIAFVAILNMSPRQCGAGATVSRRAVASLLVLFVSLAVASPPPAGCPTSVTVAFVDPFYLFYGGGNATSAFDSDALHEYFAIHLPRALDVARALRARGSKLVWTTHVRKRSRALMRASGRLKNSGTHDGDGGDGRWRRTKETAFRGAESEVAAVGRTEAPGRRRAGMETLMAHSFSFLRPVPLSGLTLCFLLSFCRLGRWRWRCGVPPHSVCRVLLHRCGRLWRLRSRLAR